jgi:hypothetical protein
MKGEEEEEGGEEGRDRPLTATETRKLAREWRARQGSVVFIHLLFLFKGIDQWEKRWFESGIVR